jgi:WD40 repeat protein
LALVLTNHDVEVWDLRTSTRVCTIHGTDDEDESVWTTSVAMMPTEAALLAGDSVGALALWPLARTREARWRLPIHRAGINAVAVSPDGRKVTTASDDETLAVTNLSDRSTVRFAEHGGRVQHAAVSGYRVLSGS